MSWKLKINEETKAPVVTDEGKIIYINPDGEELPLDPPMMYEKIQTMGKDNQKDREKYRAMRDKFSIFDSIEDIVKWKEEAETALQTVANFNEKDFLKADKVEQLKKDINSAWEDKIRQKEQAQAEKDKVAMDLVAKKDAQIRSLLVSNQFAGSSFFNGADSKTLLPPDLAESYFGKYFKVEESDDGNLSIKAYNEMGDIITSKLNPGEPAAFEEAIGMIIDRYPRKDQILRASAGGSGGGGGIGGGGGGDKLSDLQAQLKKAQENGQAALAITLKNRIFELQRKSAA